MRSIKTSGGLTRGRGFEESTRNHWILTAHQCAAINESLTELTKVQKVSSEQHVELSQARRTRDDTDFTKLYEWLLNRNPFSMVDKRLKSLSTGVIGT